MTILKHIVDIQRPLRQTYQLAQDVERYPTFLPVYLESIIVKRQGARLLVQRKALARGREHTWQSWVSFQDLKSIEFEHAMGPLKGMRVLWSFEALSPTTTRLTITHAMHVAKPFLIGLLKEKCLYAPSVRRMANQVVAGFKAACEKN